MPQSFKVGFMLSSMLHKFHENHNYETFQTRPKKLHFTALDDKETVYINFVRIMTCLVVTTQNHEPTELKI